MNEFIFTFLLIGYIFKRCYGCYQGSKLAKHSTLSEAIDYCNGHSNCNCVEFYKLDDIYSTYADAFQMSNSNVDLNHISLLTNFESWVISFYAMKQ